jgi:hypothetical protein
MSLMFNKSFSKYGDIYTMYNSHLSAFVNYVCATAIVGDAKDRHDFFFKILKEELNHRQRTGDVNQNQIVTGNHASLFDK